MDITANIEAMERLRRNNRQQVAETEMVTSAGNGISVWAVKVKSHLSYNIYKVSAVAIGQAGDEPIELGQEVEAFNLAEDFTQQGGAAVGKYGLMVKTGYRKSFYCQV